MAFKLLKPTLLTLLVAMAALAYASDPDILTDFVVPPNTSVSSQFFTYNGMRGVLDTYASVFKVTKASMAEFPALNGQSVSFAVLQFPGGGTNPPHTHPRSAELLFVIDGSLEVGFIDTTNKLYTQTLQLGDMFVFPKGLVHYQYNANNKAATAISAFGSASAGTVSIPTSVFTTGIDNVVLAKAFKPMWALSRKSRLALQLKLRFQRSFMDEFGFILRHYPENQGWPCS